MRRLSRRLLITDLKGRGDMARAERFIVLSYFQCKDCDWEQEDRTMNPKNRAQDNARRHHEKTGHTVHGDVGYSVCYRK